MIINLNASHIQNPEANNKVIPGLLEVEVIGSCYDSNTGTESEALTRADGALFNLFGHKHSRTSCEPIDQFGFRSKINYKFEVSLDTIKDGLSPIIEGNDLAIKINSPSINIKSSDQLRKRIQARLNDNKEMEFSLYINLLNDTKDPIRLYSFSTYMWDKESKKYKPYQGLNATFETGESLYLKAGSVTIDSLLENGETTLAVKMKNP